jgi:hypothetical protein
MGEAMRGQFVERYDDVILMSSYIEHFMLGCQLRLGIKSG